MPTQSLKKLPPVVVEEAAVQVTGEGAVKAAEETAPKMVEEEAETVEIPDVEVPRGSTDTAEDVKGG